jgi:hypothetical protein
MRFISCSFVNENLAIFCPSPASTYSEPTGTILSTTHTGTRTDSTCTCTRNSWGDEGRTLAMRSFLLDLADHRLVGFKTGKEFLRCVMMSRRHDICCVILLLLFFSSCEASSVKRQKSSDSLLFVWVVINCSDVLLRTFIRFVSYIICRSFCILLD